MRQRRLKIGCRFYRQLAQEAWARLTVADSSPDQALLDAKVILVFFTSLESQLGRPVWHDDNANRVARQDFLGWAVAYLTQAGPSLFRQRFPLATSSALRGMYYTVLDALQDELLKLEPAAVRKQLKQQLALAV